MKVRSMHMEDLLRTFVSRRVLAVSEGEIAAVIRPSQR